MAKVIFPSTTTAVRSVSTPVRSELLWDDDEGTFYYGDGTTVGGRSFSEGISGFPDPMTTRGDIIYKNATNVTTRLPLGTNGQFLTSNGSDLLWANFSLPDNSIANSKLVNVSQNTIKGRVSSGAGSPEDLSATQVRTLLNLGTASLLNSGTSVGEVLVLVDVSGSAGLPPIDGSLLTNLPSGFSDPMTTRGDIIYKNATNTTTRLPLGTNGQVLLSDGTDLSWGSPTFTVADNSITNSKLSDVSQNSIKGRVTAGIGDPEDLTAGQARTILNVQDGANNYSHPNHSGDVVSDGDGSTTIQVDTVTNAKLVNVAQNTIKGRLSAGLGSPEDLSASQARSLLNVQDGANNYIHPNHSGDVLSDGDGSTTIQPNTVTNSKLTDVSQNTIKGRVSAGAGSPEDLNATQARSLLNVQNGATANAPDSSLRDRTTHTGNSTYNDEAIFINESGSLIGVLTSIGGGFALTATEDLIIDTFDGGIVCKFGELDIYGASIVVESFKSTDYHQVYASPDGVLYLVDPPETGWEQINTDSGDYDLGTGSGAGTWTNVVGLNIVLAQDVNAGDRIDIDFTLYAENKTTNRNGSLEVGFSVDSGAPTAPALVSYNQALAGGFAANISGRISFTAASSYVIGDTVSFWARINNGSHSQFGIDLLGSTQSHQIFVSSPSGGSTTPTTVESTTVVLESPSDKSYPIESYAIYAYDINSLNVGTESGTCTVAIQINGVNVTGLAGLSATDSSLSVTNNATANNAVAIGDRVTLLVSGSSSPVDLEMTLKTTRT